MPDFKTAFRLDIDLRQLLTMVGASAIDADYLIHDRQSLTASPEMPSKRLPRLIQCPRVAYCVAELVQLVSVLGLQALTRPVRATTTRRVSSNALVLGVSVLAIVKLSATGAALLSTE